MSATYTARALNTPASIPPTQRLVLALLGDHADADGMTQISVSRIASLAQISETTATRALNSLENASLVQRTRTVNAASLFRLTLGARA